MKKIALVGLILFVVLIAGCSQTTTTTSDTGQEATKQETQIYTGNTENLLPERDEINTEYEILTTEDFDITKYFSKYQTKGLMTTGFESGSYMEHEILEEFPRNTITVGYIFILKFDSVDNADLFYTTMIDMIKNEGGYKEISSFWIDADCFGKEGFYPDYPLNNYYQNFFCKKKNIFFNTETSGYKKSRLSDSEEWAKTIADKI
ncbi:MAG: hypothetical protein ABIE55_03660 [Candidatus Aenigmatarchaeota archaeon]